jgi:hypothetical protein
VKRPNKPDDAERNTQVQLLQDEIVKYINRWAGFDVGKAVWDACWRLPLLPTWPLGRTSLGCRLGLHDMRDALALPIPALAARTSSWEECM